MKAAPAIPKNPQAHSQPMEGSTRGISQALPAQLQLLHIHTFLSNASRAQ